MEVHREGRSDGRKKRKVEGEDKDRYDRVLFILPLIR